MQPPCYGCLRMRSVQHRPGNLDPWTCARILSGYPSMKEEEVLVLLRKRCYWQTAAQGEHCPAKPHYLTILPEPCLASPRSQPCLCLEPASQLVI